MKNLVFLFCLVSMLPLSMIGQSTVLQSAEDNKTEEAKLKVLVIPFHQLRYYFSDCDKQIATRNKMELPDVRQSFMLGLDYATENKLDKKYEPMNLAQMKDSIDRDYIAKFYDNVTYNYETPNRVLTKKQGAVMNKVKDNFKSVGQDNKKGKTTLADAENYSTLNAEDDRYMRLNWSKPEFLESLNAVYQPDYIVTINQFEIRTDFQKCIDRELGKYARIIKVHYNVFRPDGKLVYGDVVSAHYNSTNDDINGIILDNFGLLSEYVLQSLPGGKPGK